MPTEDDLFPLSAFKKTPTHLQHVHEFVDSWGGRWRRKDKDTWTVVYGVYESERSTMNCTMEKPYMEAYRLGLVEIIRSV